MTSVRKLNRVPAAEMSVDGLVAAGMDRLQKADDATEPIMELARAVTALGFFVAAAVRQEQEYERQNEQDGPDAARHIPQERE